MEPMVSGRVPLMLRNRVNSRLKRMGSSPTELINKAYEYVDATGMLPRCEKTPSPGVRRLSHEQRTNLERELAASTFAVPASYFAGQSDDDLLEEELRRAYEALS